MTATEHGGRVQLANLLASAKENLRIAVVYGGDKKIPGRVLHQALYTRPWKSYEEVATDIADALIKSGFRHVVLMEENIDLLRQLHDRKINFVWTNSGGVQGVDPVSHLPAMLEMAGVPYVGHNPVNASMLDNKHLLKWGMRAKGIATPPFFLWSQFHERFPGTNHKKYQNNFADYDGPFIVKPCTGRASLHVEYVERADDLADVIEEIANQTNNAIIVEKYMSGKEYAVSVMGPVACRDGVLKIEDAPVCFSALERPLEEEERVFTSMDIRPITADRANLLNKKDNTEEVTELNRLARAIFYEFNIETLVRIDVRADENGVMHVLEANPKPDLKRPSMTRTSLVCIGLEQERMSYQDLLTSNLTQRLYDLCVRGMGASGAILTDTLRFSG